MDNSNGGISIFGICFLIFLTLKLAGIGVVATWSWWAITAPLWAPVVLFAIVLIIIYIIKQLL